MVWEWLQETSILVPTAMNKQQLANRIWASANKMRSKIEANEYKDYYCCPVNFQTAQESFPKPFRIGLRAFFFKKQAPLIK